MNGGNNMPGFVPGPGIQTVGLGPLGTAIIGSKKSRPAASVTDDVRLRVRRSDGAYVYVTVGMVTGAGGGQVIPMIGTTAIDIAPAPTLLITANGWVYLRAVLGEQNEIAAAYIAFGTSVPSSTDTVANLAIARISNFTPGPPIDFVINQLIYGSVFHQKCGGGHLFGSV
jgi:hypothetical protein